MSPNPKAPAAGRRRGTMKFLALADLKHEWLLNLCMILALAAILTPLLLLLGLKNGTIQTLRDRLIEDPVYRELKPQQGLELDEDWFSAIEARPEVAFVIPTILRGSSIVRANKKGDETAVSMDLLPSGPGDTLILENGGVIPAEGQAVLAADAADKLGARAGDTLEVRVTRTRDGRFEAVTAELEVVHVLSPRADALQRIYAPLQFVVDVETYREGRGVPKRDWPGGSASPYLSFDGVFVVAPKRLDPITAGSLTVGTGFSVMDIVTADDLARRTGLSVPADFTVYDVHVVNEPVTWSAIKGIRDKLRGRGVVILPYTQTSELTVHAERGDTVTIAVFGLSPSQQDSAVLGLPELPWGSLKPDTPYADYAQILLPANAAVAIGEKLNGQVTQHPEIPAFPLTVAGDSFSDFGIVPAELLAVLRTGEKRQIIYSQELQDFQLARAGYSGFRLYSRSIDDVADLHRMLREQGIETIAQVQAIERIRILDRGLTRIFWLVAIVGIIGGIAALIASLYAAVERKKRDISMMRLMGLSRFAVSRFPIYQSAAIAALAAGLAIGGFYTLAGVINAVFSADLALGERICQLPASALAIALFVTVAAAVSSSLFAAWRTTRIEPAEAIRVE